MSDVRFRGTLIKWNDERGFGFIRPDADQNDQIFLHIGDFRGARRPVDGDVLTFVLHRQSDGRMRAFYARIAGTEKAPMTDPWRMGAAVFCLGAATVLVLKVGFAWVLLIYPFMSCITVIAYRNDKSSAKSGRWRTPEGTLLGLEMLGGWPGAVWAQQKLRHKNAKPSFQDSHKAIIAVHVIAWSVVMWSLFMS